MKRQRLRFGRLLQMIRNVIPEGRSLPEKEWQVRHRTILLLTWLHALGLTAFGFYRGFGATESLGEGGLIAAAAMVGSWKKLGRSARAAAASLGLITSSAILVQLSGGYIEAHFHFFVMLAVISLYQDWVPYLLAILFVTLEHGLTGQFVPTVVYNHPDAFAHPWKWAVIHALFVLCESAVLLANWRISEQAHARADLVLNSTGETIIGLDPHGIITFANQAAVGMTGYPLDALVGQPINRLFQTAKTDSPRLEISPLLQDGKIERRVDRVIVCRDGTQRRVDSAMSPIREHGSIVGAVVTLKDETERRETEETLKQTFSLLSATIESTADGILVVDRAGKLVRFNRKFIQMWNLPPPLAAGQERAQENEKTLNYLIDQLKEPEGFLISLRKRHVELEPEHQELLELKDGRVFELFSQPQRIGGKTVGRVWSFRDITERKQTEARLRHLANFDPLTRLPNRTLFYDRLGRAITRARWPERPVAVLFLDLDRFKTINDTLGHPFGDLLLTLVAERLTRCVREGDTVARLSGDEFVILLEDLQERQDVRLIAQKIVEALSNPFKLEGREIFITTSVGGRALSGRWRRLRDPAQECRHRHVSCEGARTKPLSALLARAGGQGKRSARAGKRAPPRVGAEGAPALLSAEDRFDDSEDHRNGIDSPLEAPRLRDGLPGRIYSAGGRDWPDSSDRGMGLTDRLRPDPSLAGKRPFAPLRMAVNISARQFQRQNFYKAITRLLDEIGLSPECLELELKESTLMNGSEATLAALRRLKALGVNISINDFGTGSSSLNQLKRFPVSTLKIDRTFIHNLTTDSEDRAIVTAIITLAHSLNLKVIAKAVETDVQLQLLHSLQCDQFQGYLVSHPPRRGDRIALVSATIEPLPRF